MSDLPKVSHYGTICIGDLAFDGVVLEDGTRGYVQRQLVQAIGFYTKNPGSRFQRFLAETAPKALSVIEKSGSPVVVMPHGGKAKFLPAGILTEIVSGVVDAALDGTLHTQRQFLLAPCRAIYRALAETGEVALIDEATGYQYHREPDALQDLFSKLIRQSCATWERRFHPDYYQSLFRLFGWEYTGQPRKPPIIGAITLKWVYEIAFPPEILAEVKERQQSAKMHQWLTEEGGLPILEKQRDAVMMIAETQWLASSATRNPRPARRPAWGCCGDWCQAQPIARLYSGPQLKLSRSARPPLNMPTLGLSMTTLGDSDFPIIVSVIGAKSDNKRLIRLPSLDRAWVSM